MISNETTTSTTFQTAVKTNVSRTNHYEAIDALARKGETTNLAILVRTSDLRSEFRRQALDGPDLKPSDPEIETKILTDC
ncbi:hypothetical protein EA472_05480 [Natrarchaeobius oligotrophus]|uniref:Uncharacterized protein n=1 Tax=Natrarchaeobius chitinivorans TaxID=1679083 RepID=A0A3N6MCX4_NATCH|nr:hypothetical protein EA472_05480 [Natrarchaeobius chitinivorans]